MQQRWKVSTIIVVILFTCFLSYSSSTAARTFPLPQVQIVIDPGHGGIDSGATYEEVEEKHINLAVASQIYQALIQKGYRAIMTRERDEALSDSSPRKDIGSRHQRDLVQRGDIIRSFSPQIVISIHVNSGSSKKLGGQVLYHHSGQGYLLAHLIQRNLNEVTGANERPLQNRTLYILNRSNTIALIIELGYLSNPEDRSRLLQREYQQQLVKAIVSGIDEFMLIYPFHLR